MEDGSARFSWRLLWAYTGPGWLMSIAYIDPGNLESDLQAGAYTGYQLSWVLFLATACGLFLQVLACRLGVVTGQHLAQLCRAHYPRRTAVALWLMTELAIIGSDIQEVVGSAIAFNILFGLRLWIGVLITGCDTFTFLLLHYLGIRKLEAFFAALIATMAVCFFVNFAEVAPPAGDIARGFVPYFQSYAAFQAVGIIGAVIMPHNLYLHSALVQSRSIDRTRPAKLKEANFYFSIESAVALFVSFLINLVVICVFAAAFFDPECAKTGTARWHGGDCQEVGLAEAGDALEGALGKAAQTVWAIGLLAAGQSSTMTGTYAGQFVFEGFTSLSLAPWVRVAVTRAIALVPATLVALLSSTNAGLADSLDQYLNILQSVQLPFAVLPLLRFTSSAAVMGAFANSRWLSATGWTLSVLFIASNLYLIFDFLVTPNSPIPHQPWFYALVGVVGVAYLAFITFIVWEDLQAAYDWLRGNERRPRKWETHENGQRLVPAHSVNGQRQAGEDGREEDEQEDERKEKGGDGDEDDEEEKEEGEDADAYGPFDSGRRVRR